MILQADFSTGASGDKLLGALLELCERRSVASLAQLEQLGQALVPGVRVERSLVSKAGIRASHLKIAEKDAPLRSWSQIRVLIETAAARGFLGDSAAALAIRAFLGLAEAEAEAHGVALEQVHFHEVGAADSILDIVGCSFLLDALRATRFFATPLALGNGTVQSEHGELPVPAPATAHLICGLPVYASSQQGELTTPTGAALARVFITDWAPLPPMTPLAIGYGAGSRDLPGAANVVRIIAGEAASLTGFSEQDGFIVEGCVLLETNIDHLAPEALAFACEELLRAGALDVWQESITMKKGRLAIRLSVLSQASEAQRLAEAVSALTGSLGVRGSYVERTVAPRTMVTLETRFGPVPFKAAKIDAPVGRISWLRPEHDAVAALARQHGLDYNALYRELARLASYPDIEHRP